MLGVDKVVELLHEVVEEAGEDHRYKHVSGRELNGCRYEYNGAPSCLVGHVLHRAGWSVNALRDLDEGGIAAQDLWYADLPDGVPGVTQGAALALETAQVFQDDGDTWGTALRAAIKVAADGGNDEL